MNSTKWNGIGSHLLPWLKSLATGFIFLIVPPQVGYMHEIRLNPMYPRLHLSHAPIIGGNSVKVVMSIVPITMMNDE